jgi:hypothetical protein
MFIEEKSVQVISRLFCDLFEKLIVLTDKDIIRD